MVRQVAIAGATGFIGRRLAMRHFDQGDKASVLSPGEVGLRKLEIQYKWMAEHPDVVLSGHPSAKIAVGDQRSALPSVLVAHHVSDRQLLFSNCFPTRSVMLKCGETYRFLPEKRYAEDYLLWLTIVFSGCPAWVLNMPMAYTFKEDFVDGGLTGNLWQLQRGVIDTYRRLLSSGFISHRMFMLISSYSYLKFFRRWCIVKWRALFN